MPRRHSKQAGGLGAEAPTYHERRAFGYGTVRERLGSDSIGAFYDCCLTLQPAVDPVVTPDGFLYSREAIVSSLLRQKKAAKRVRGEWEAMRAREEQRAAEGALAAADAEVAAFDRRTNAGASAAGAAGAARAIRDEAARAAAPGAASSSFVTRLDEQRAHTMAAFWAAGGGGGGVGGAGEGAGGAGGAPSPSSLPPKPSDETVCPASGKRLRLKDLQPVRFTRAEDPEQGDDEEEEKEKGGEEGGGAGGPSGGGGGRKEAPAAPRPAQTTAGGPGAFIDPVTRRELTNASRLVVLVPSGHVMTRESYEAAVLADGGDGAPAEYAGSRVERAIALRTGGTGFSGRSGAKLESQRYFAVGQGSGLADVRGQNPSAASRFAGRIV